MFPSFADPQFDGDPVQIYEPKENEDIVPPDPPEDIQEEETETKMENGNNDGNNGEDQGRKICT